METTEKSREAGFKGWVKHVWDEGLARKLVVDHKDGKNLVRLPLTLVVIGAVIAPWAAAVGAIIAVVTGCRLAIELDEEGPVEALEAGASGESEPPPPPPPPAVDEASAVAEAQAASDEPAP